MATMQHFGGSWTVEKINVLSNYSNAYVTALKNQPFDLIYIDAFAGTGKVQIKGEELLEIDGSAKIALDAKEAFSKYYFIEKNNQYLEELNSLIRQYPEKEERVSIYQADCNEQLKQICKKTDWNHYRALLFLDPYSTEVKWDTLEIISETHAIDVWYLFPFSAALRLMKKKGNIPDSWKAKLNEIFGDDSWEHELYEQNIEINLFEEESSLIRYKGTDALRKYIIKRLGTVFARVSSKSIILYGKTNNPLFLFCFAVSNNNPAAQNLAFRIADYILKQ